MMRTTVWATLLTLLLTPGCGGDDDDTGADGDADADADADTTAPEVTADPELPETIRAMGLLTTTLRATDPDDEELEWTVVEPDGATIDATTGLLTYRVPLDATGEISVAVDVSDGTNTTRFEHTATVEPLAWQEVAPAWDAQEFAATALDAGRRVVWSIGGFGETRSTVVMRNDLAAGTWERVALSGDPLPPLFAAGACYLPSLDLVVLVGGFPGHLTRDIPSNQDVFTLDVSADPVVVTRLDGDQTPIAHFPRLACSPDAARAFLIGTFDLDGIQMTPYMIDLSSGLTVTELPADDLPPPRAYFGLAVVGATAYVFGGDPRPGEPAENLNDLWTFALDESGTYDEVVTTGEAPAPRSNTVIATDGDTLAIVGGFERGVGAVADAYFLELATATWTPGTLDGESAPFLTQNSVFDEGVSTVHLLAPRLSNEETDLYTDARDVSLDLDLAAGVATMVFSDPAPGQGPRRRFNALVGVGGNLSDPVVYGGSTAVLNANNALEDAWTIDLETGVWSPAGNDGEAPGPRQAGAFVTDDRGRILSIGGWNGHDLSDIEVRAYDPDDGDWRAIESSGDVPSARLAPCAAYNPDSGTILVFGGVGESGRSGEVYELSVGSTAGEWRRIEASSGPEGRAFSGCGYDSGSRRFLVVGGEDLVGVFGDVWALELAEAGSETWHELEPEGDDPGGVTDMVTIVDPVGRKLVLFAGTSGTQFFGDVYFLDLLPGHESWTRLDWDPTGPEVRAAAGGFYHAPSASLVIFGGRVIDPGVAAFNDVWRLSL